MELSKEPTPLDLVPPNKNALLGPAPITTANSDSLGIGVLANDKVIKWTMTLLESWRKNSPSLPVAIIAYDDNMSETLKLAKAYGADVITDGFEKIDELAKRLFPYFPYLRRRLRKLRVLSMDVEQVIYLDADIIILNDLSHLKNKLKSKQAEIIVASESKDYVYRDNVAFSYGLGDKLRFSDGFFTTSRKWLSLDLVLNTINNDEELFHKIRKRGRLIAQPLMNFICHRNNLAIRTLSDIIPTSSNETYYYSNNFKINGDKVYDNAGKEIYICHWAGPFSNPNFTNSKVNLIWRRYFGEAEKQLLNKYP